MLNIKRFAVVIGAGRTCRNVVRAAPTVTENEVCRDRFDLLIKGNNFNDALLRHVHRGNPL